MRERLGTGRQVFESTSQLGEGIGESMNVVRRPTS